MKISVLDQSIVRRGGTARQALDETLATAQLADRLGYHRFWVSEHHNSTSIAGSAPELLMVRLAGATEHIRVDSGGIMLPNHSALKVAENFRMLETLFPGRIDLGMGRAPGSDRITAQLLNPANDFSEESYLRQLGHLQAYFADEASTQYGPVIAIPQAQTVPAQWVLSSSGGSSRIAARFGMGLAVARFINGFAGPDVVEAYRKLFEPSKELAKPVALLALMVLCADTEEKAMQMRKEADYRLLQFEKGNFGPPPPFAEIAAYRFSSSEEESVRRNAGRIVSGTKESVKDHLTRMAEEFGVDEIMATTMSSDAEDRRRSFELLAEAFELVPEQVPQPVI